MSYNILDNDLREAETTFEFATFLDRAKASIIDTLVFIPIVALMIQNWISWKSYELDLLINIGLILYKPIFEWKYGATIGKMIAKIKVVDISNNFLTLEQSFRRFAIYFVGYGISLLASYNLFHDPAFQEALSFMDIGALQQDSPLNDFSQFASFLTLMSVTFVAFDEKKQALHDKLATTYVVKIH